MLTLPTELLPLIGALALLFSQPVWEHTKVLLVSALLAPGTRTVPACLRIIGLSQEQCFINSHRLLNRARWAALAASQPCSQTGRAQWGAMGRAALPLRLGMRDSNTSDRTEMPVALAACLALGLEGGVGLVTDSRASRQRSLGLCVEKHIG